MTTDTILLGSPDLANERGISIRTLGSANGCHAVYSVVRTESLQQSLQMSPTKGTSCAFCSSVQGAVRGRASTPRKTAADKHRTTREFIFDGVKKLVQTAVYALYGVFFVM